MDKFQEKLKKFLDEDCGEDWSNCQNCPNGHYKDGACCHPDHPSMQEVGASMSKMAPLHPTISKTLHDIRNTYQSLIFMFDNPDEKDLQISPEKVILQINSDLAMMIEAEKGYKLCANNSHLQVAPYEHCPDCSTRTGGGRCRVCEDLIQSEGLEG